jgi:hypothetical protein
LVLLLALAVLMTLFIPAMEAASRRRGRGGRKSASSVGRGRQQGRRGKVISGRERQQGRRGRTNYDSDAASADANGVDGGEEEIHNRGVQNVSNMDSHLALWFFPLFSAIMNSTTIFRNLAYQKHPPLVTTFCTRKYKGFSKFIKENIFRSAFQFFYFKRIF